MKFDKYAYIELEQSKFPGSIGDSCAETSRYLTLATINRASVYIDLSKFFTDRGVIRHPKSPWPETDTSGDQIMPLLAACDLTDQKELAAKLYKLISNSGWKSGNGDLISPGGWAQLRRYKRSPMLWISDLMILGQALLMKLPWRWSDSKKKIEPMEGSTADYLNFINAIAYAKGTNTSTWPIFLAIKLYSKKSIMDNVALYYRPEPNNKLILQAYEKALNILWK